MNILDKGFVRLVDHMGSDLSVARAARVSYDAAWRAGENEGSDTRLIHYLWRNHHTTPFEAVTFSFEIKLPIFLARQWHRHRTWTYNELSARYRELPEDFYIPAVQQIGLQSASSKQAREIPQEQVDELIARRETQTQMLRQRCEAAFILYRALLADGWPRELARMVLPVNTYTHMFATVDLLNLLKFLTLRCDAHAQWEIQQYANAILEIIRPIVPVCVAAWEQK